MRVDMLVDRTGLTGIRRDMLFLCETLGRRLAGWPQEERAADYVLARLRDLGLTGLAKRPFPIRRWHPAPAHLVRLDDGRRVRVEQVAHAAATPPSGVAGELVVLEPVEVERGLRRRDLAGKIALFHGSYGASAAQFRRLHASPLRALLFVDPRMQTSWPIANGLGERFMALVRKPMACLSLMDATALVRDGVRRVRLVCRGCAEPAVSWNVWGDLAGRDPRGRVIVLSAHLDSVSVGVGADDNASGVAAILECARRLRGRRPRHTLRVMAFGAEEQLSIGAMRYVEEQATDLARIAFVCNFDAIAAPFGRSLAVCSGTPALDRYLRGWFERRLRFGLVEPGVDPCQDLFPFAARGIPGVWLTRKTHLAGYWYHHSAHNRPGNLSLAQIARTAAAAAALAGDLAARRAWPFPRRLSPRWRLACQNYLRDLY